MESTTDPDAPSLDPLAQIDWTLGGKQRDSMFVNWVMVVGGILGGLALIGNATRDVLAGAGIEMTWWAGWYALVLALEFFETRALRSPNWWGRGLDALTATLPSSRGEAWGRFEVLPGMFRPGTRPFFLLFAPHRLLLVLRDTRWPVRALLLAAGIVPILSLHPSVGGADGGLDVALTMIWAIWPYLIGASRVGTRVVLHEIANDDVVEARLSADESGFLVTWHARGLPENVELRPEGAWFESLARELRRVAASASVHEEPVEAEEEAPSLPDRTGWRAVVELALAGLALSAALFVFRTGNLAPDWDVAALLLTLMLPFAMIRVWLRHAAPQFRIRQTSRPRSGRYAVKARLRGFRRAPVRSDLRGDGVLRTDADRWTLHLHSSTAWGSFAVLGWTVALCVAPGVTATTPVGTRIAIGLWYVIALWAVQSVCLRRVWAVEVCPELVGIDVNGFSDRLRLHAAPYRRPREYEFEIEPRHRAALLAEVERRWPQFVGEPLRAWATLPDVPRAVDRVDPGTERQLADVQQRYQEIDP